MIEIFIFVLGGGFVGLVISCLVITYYELTKQTDLLLKLHKLKVLHMGRNK